MSRLLIRAFCLCCLVAGGGLRAQSLLKLETTALLDPIIPALELYGEIPIQRRMSVQAGLGGGLGIPNLIPWVPNRRSATNFKVRAGLRYYFYEAGPLQGWYLGGEYSYIRHSYLTDSSGFVVPGTPDLSYFETARVRRRILASSLVVGWQGAIGTRWVLDVFAGMGIRTIELEYVDTVRGGPFAGRPDPLENFLNADVLNGPRYGMALRGGLSIGYWLGAPSSQKP